MDGIERSILYYNRHGSDEPSAPSICTDIHPILAHAAMRNPLAGARRSRARPGYAMNYRPDISDAWRRSAAFVDKVLNGAMPGDLPIQPTAFKLVVNVKTAKALGIDVPISILAGVEERIERDFRCGDESGTGTFSPSKLRETAEAIRKPTKGAMAK